MGLWEVCCCLRVAASSETEGEPRGSELTPECPGVGPDPRAFLSLVRATPAQSRPASRPWALVPRRVTPRAHPVRPAGQPHRRPRSEAGPAAAEVKRGGKARAWPRRPSRGELRWDSGRNLQGPAKDGAWGQNCARGRAGPTRDRALLETPVDRIGLSGPWLQDEPRTHTLTWVPLVAVTTEKPAWPPFEEGRAARPRALGRRKGLPDPQPSAASALVLRLTQAQPSVSPEHRTTLRAADSSFCPILPPHPLRPCVLRTRSISEWPPASGLHPLGPPPREVSDGGELQLAHIRSPAAFLPTLLHDGGWEPGIGGGSNHTVEAGKHCRSGLFFFFFLESWLLTIQQHTTTPE